ncbi:hypothetical protein D3H55_13125 [Bacillus salacetis]|uniref:Uncharacterized protein n=1 Tax=Bacillus salacetis TaxID=2315464 RepID=A0A3A1R0L8_9BACI|nr:hypothetical protein [Bacillus salacetis]RIW32523.1 hypothetical protein D3H55_13125 [Bacillus salacetis]
MFWTIEDTIEVIKIGVGVILSAQFTYGCTIAILEKTMLGFYKTSIYDPPTTVFQKITNTFQKGLLGSGYYIYTKIEKYNWFVRKILFLIALAIQGILSIILYYIITGLLELIFLS